MSRYNSSEKHTIQGRFYVGTGGTCPQIHMLPLPHIQKLADRSDVISEVPKCSKILIFRASAPDPAGGAYSASPGRHGEVSPSAP